MKTKFKKVYQEGLKPLFNQATFCTSSLFLEGEEAIKLVGVKM